MSEFNLIWRRYGLKENPYFNAPLSIDGGSIDLSSFVGREKEQEELKRIVEMGNEVRFMIVGAPGVGKTSLVNFVRNKAAQSKFFTPVREIEINRVMPGNELIIITISAIYSEIKRLGLEIKPDLKARLDALYELTQYGELSNDIANLTTLNRHRLMDLFKELVEEVVNPRFKGLIIHYDNLDNIKDPEELLDLLSDVRDFLMTSKVIFFFVGDLYLPSMVSFRRRVGQIFLTPSLEVPNLSYGDISEILLKRMEKLKARNATKFVVPHTEKALRKLYDLHGGNLREILNSLSSCMISLPPSNTSIQITEDLLKDLLYQKVEDKYLNKLTNVEKEILSKILDNDYLTPTKLSELTGKTRQNISSKYLSKLVMIGAVRLRSIEGRNKYYEVSPEIKWWKFKRSDKEKFEAKEARIKKVREIMQSSLEGFI